MARYRSFRLTTPSALAGAASLSVVFSSLSIFFALALLGLKRWLAGFDLGLNDFAGLPFVLLLIALCSLLAATGLIGLLLGVGGLFRAGHRFRAALGILEAFVAVLIFALAVWWFP